MTPAHSRELIRLLLLVALIASFASNALAQVPPEDVRKSLERAVKSGSVQKTVCPGAPYCNPSSVIRFYQMRKYEPAWTRDGYPLPVAESPGEGDQGSRCRGPAAQELPPGTHRDHPRLKSVRPWSGTKGRIRQASSTWNFSCPMPTSSTRRTCSTAASTPRRSMPTSGRSTPRASTWRAISRRP